MRLPLGAHPGNTGGKPGRSGRRPREITLLARELIDKHQLLDRAARIAARARRNADSLAAIKFLVEYGHGKPPQRVYVRAERREWNLDQLSDRELEQLERIVTKAAVPENGDGERVVAVPGRRW